MSTTKPTNIKNNLLNPEISRVRLFCTALQHYHYTFLGRTLKPSVRPSVNKKVKKYLLQFFTGMALLLLFSSCEKVIDVDLNNAAKKFVIEGVVSNQQGASKVQITQTINFSDASVYPAVSGAVVTIKDENNSPVTLAETSPGIYETNAISGTVGHTYTLSVTISGQVFSASSQMPQQVNLDSLFTKKNDVFGDPINLANVVFRDPIGKGNSYRFIQYRNGVENKTIFVANDDFSDGRVNTTILRAFDNDDDDNKKDELNSRDTVRVEMQCIDPAIYKYWYSLNQSGTGASNNATPGNPVTNISNSALGYFSAHTSESKSKVVR